MSKARILVVDDEEVLRTSIKNLLGDNYGVEQAASAIEAFEKIKKGRFDVILLDIKMPGMSGLDALINIKLLTPTSAVIMVSALDMADTAWKAFQAGAVYYLTKPFKREDLIKQIEVVLERKKAMDVSGRKSDLVAEIYAKGRQGGKFSRRMDYFSELFSKKGYDLGEVSVEELEEIASGKRD
ncbi:MAG: response regulator [Candidatus Saganbacteria bacterium]|nr:response regulator [Candidatus Saganbacteria bacterium]